MRSIPFLNGNARDDARFRRGRGSKRSNFFLLPAAGAFPYCAPAHPGLATSWQLVLHDISGLRDGSSQVDNVPKPEGPVATPSFHSIVAILLAYAMRGWRVLFPLAIVWSGLILVPTSLTGGH